CVRTRLNFMVSGVDSMPALDRTPTVLEVDSLKVDAWSLVLYREMLKAGDWSGHEDLRRAVRRIVHPLPHSTLRRRAVRFLRRELLGQVSRLQRMAPFGVSGRSPSA